MPALCDLPLDQLLPHCRLPLPSCLPLEEAAWQELQRRALAGNDRAWDAWVALLWPALLAWIYHQLPDLAPTLAAELAQTLLLHAKRLHALAPAPLTTLQLASHFQGAIAHRSEALWARLVGKTNNPVPAVFTAIPLRRHAEDFATDERG